MSETPFFKTRMGHRFYEHTMPALVKQLERLNSILERLSVELKNEASDRTSDDPS